MKKEEKEKEKGKGRRRRRRSRRRRRIEAEFPRHSKDLKASKVRALCFKTACMCSIEIKVEKVSTSLVKSLYKGVEFAGNEPRYCTDREYCGCNS